MADDSTQGAKLDNAVRIDDARVKYYLGNVVRCTLEETLNALLYAEADRLCNAARYERTEAPGQPRRLTARPLP